MALIRYGGGIIQMSGSIAGNVYARNRYGNYARARTKPINPNKPGQAEVRAAIAFLVEAWSQTLDPTMRDAWDLYAMSTKRLNKLGEDMRLSGFNDFVRSNAIRKRNGDLVIVAGPTIFEIPEHDTKFAFTSSQTTQIITVTYDETAAWCSEHDAHFYVFVGKPMNAQRSFFAGPWRFGAAEDGTSGNGLTGSLEVPSPFVITEGQRIWCYARIARADGRLSEPFRAGPTLVANGV